MSEVAPTQKPRLESILDSVRNYAERENAKGWKQRLGESVRDFYDFGRGIAKSGLKQLQNGLKTSPPGVLLRELSETRKMLSDFHGYAAERERDRLSSLREIGEALDHPAARLRQLWEGGQDYLTARTISFLEAPRSRQMEMAGELAGDLVPFVLGAQEGINAVRLPPIPGGGLLAHEGIVSATGARSHTIFKHVGKNLEEMQELLKTQRPKVISSFRNLKSAEKMVRRVLKKERAQIREFLAQPYTPGIPQRLHLRTYLGRNTGDTYRLGTDRIVPGSGVQLILERTPHGEYLPFLIPTSFPIP